MAGANTHLTHLEELVLTQGPKGYNMARAFLLELLETLKGNSESHVQTSVKWDGAPAMFVGINPENGRFFVGTKSIFNKVPKINYTEEDIIKNHGHAPGLVDKLTKALKYLPSLGIKNILQGDFMFDDEMLDIIDIDGEPHYRFKPNTIVYTVPVNSDLGQEIGQSKFGIVFHTTYDSLDSGASFGADVSGLNRVPGIWFDDAFFTDDTGTVTLTSDEENKVTELVKEADTANEQIDYNNIPSDFLNVYINSEIKLGNFLEDPEKSFVGFTNWYAGRIEKKINNLKSEKGRARATQTGKEALESINNKKEDILNLFRVSRLLFEAKNIFIEKYNNAVYNTKHFVDDGSGDLVATNPEGYVAVDRDGNGIKFVDRLEFSRANFLIDKTAKFSENVSTKEFTVVISKNVTVTKTLNEWMQEAKTSNHIYKKLPQMVYNEILSGAPIVSIVVKEDAEKAIYNAVIGYVNSLYEGVDDDEYSPWDSEADEWYEDRFVSDQEAWMDIEDEDDDPVTDSNFPKTVAIVPGAFKPPHKGHLAMVEEYAAIADEVIVLISMPTKSGRYIDVTLPDGKEEKREITADDSLKIWELLVGGLDNVVVGIFNDPSIRSPISAAYAIAGPADERAAAAAKVEPKIASIPPGSKIILGASTKDGDADRWAMAEKYVGGGPDGDLELIPPAGTAVTPTVRPDGTPFSATDMRELLGRAKEDPDAVEELEDFIGEDSVFDLLSILGLGVSVTETSVAGAVQGAVGANDGPWAGATFTRFNDEEREKSKLKKSENIDLNIIDDVMRLIIEKGIMR
tara:strand:- start:1486 stop:3879 length:2394 start_codon:yes stop_codon:yes gene_type:complete